MICDQCETVAHCLKNGCVPKQPSKDEALKLALEALETDPLEMIEDEDGHMVFRRDVAITAIKQALLTATPLAVPAQEPVAFFD